MKLTELTNEQLLEVYNANFGEELPIDHVDIERDTYGNVEMHKVGFCDDMMLIVSSGGAIYLICLDNGEVYHDVIGALNHLKHLEVEPFA